MERFGPLRAAVSRLVVASHPRTGPSGGPPASHFPSGDQARLYKEPASIAKTFFPVPASTTVTADGPATAKRWPPGLKATFPWPVLAGTPFNATRLRPHRTPTTPRP